MKAGKLNSSVCHVWLGLANSAIGLLLVTALIMAAHKTNLPPTPVSTRDTLQWEVQDLKSKVEQLRKEQIMPAAVLSRYGNSIGYICGVYHVGFPNQPPDIRTRFSGTGFLVADGLVATNRHVAEPWVGDSEAENLIRRGASPTLESAVVFFPGLLKPAKLSHRFVSETSDLAILRTENSEAIHALPVLPLAESSAATGQFVTVIGYPLGIAGMIAKSPPNVNKHLASRPHLINAPKELAALSLIRPSITFGHVGDIIADKLIYDAPTAPGGSGGPVFNSRGEVVAVNTAYMHGFSGANIGISVKSLYQLLDDVRGISTAQAMGGKSSYSGISNPSQHGHTRDLDPSQQITHSASLNDFQAFRCSLALCWQKEQFAKEYAENTIKRRGAISRTGIFSVLAANKGNSTEVCASATLLFKDSLTLCNRSEICTTHIAILSRLRY